VLAQERHEENTPFIGSWTRDEHAATIADAAREHWILEDREGARLGYLIAYDLVAAGHGVYVKRIVVAEKSRGRGRAALARFCDHAFCDLGAQHVWLSVYRANERAQRAYRALGFQPLTLDPARRAELVGAAGGFSERSVVMILPRSARAGAAGRPGS
jgi:ribosomal protein S18 acetylase RimI-like enzyme